MRTRKLTILRYDARPLGDRVEVYDFMAHGWRGDMHIIIGQELYVTVSLAAARKKPHFFLIYSDGYSNDHLSRGIPKHVLDRKSDPKLYDTILTLLNL